MNDVIPLSRLSFKDGSLKHRNLDDQPISPGIYIIVDGYFKFFLNRFDVARI